ncbi:MAG: YihY family inner membrane protein [Candidatus Wallbacteria bacterium]|nr:YihY family inner membrane protein [Candidatus Wallbacteria bacterium]
MKPDLSLRIATGLDRVRNRPGLPVWLRRLLTGVHFFAMVYAQFERDRCYQMASALTFSSLLAVVPVTAVTFAIFNAFGTFSSIRDSVQEFLLKQLTPTRDLSQNLNHYLTQFTANTYQVTFLSVISLFVTAVTLFLTVEYSLGHIWIERNRRSFVRNVTIFTSVLVWGPLLLGFSTYLSISLTTRAHTYVDPIIGSRLWSYLFHYATSVLMFFLGFTILPASSVQVRAALLGSAFSALMWEIAKAAFAVYTSEAVFYSSVYGPLSTVPVFLLWVYTSWLIFLYGAEICHCYQYHKWLRMRSATPEGRGSVDADPRGQRDLPAVSEHRQDHRARCVPGAQSHR